MAFLRHDIISDILNHVIEQPSDKPNSLLVKIYSKKYAK